LSGSGGRAQTGQQAAQLIGRRADDLLEARATLLQRGLRRHFAALHAVQTRLGFMKIGDLALPDVEARLGAIALLPQGRLLGLYHAQRLLPSTTPKYASATRKARS
jgi:hypothetical protein